MLHPDAQVHVRKSYIPFCVLRFLTQIERFGAQAIFETQWSFQQVVWQGVGYFLMAVKTIEISEP